MTDSSELNRLLDALERDPDGGRPLFGQEISDAVRRAKYPTVWRPLVDRYTRLVRENRSTANVNLYCDMACTVITKKIMMVDIFYLYDRAEDGVEDRRLREAHMVTATKYLVKMATCMYECVYGRSPNAPDMDRSASLLYAEIYAEAFDVTSVREEEVFLAVRKWFCAHVLVGGGNLPENVAPGIPFLFCSHVYWLWLHLTAARVRYAAQDLLTVVYALDLIVYCEECRLHFLDHRPLFFVEESGGAINCYTRSGSNADLLFDLHNKINVQTGSPVMDRAILSEFKQFWES